METEIQGQILSVQGRRTNSGKTIYDIAFSDGQTYTTFDGNLAQKANGLVSQNVSARVKVQQKGNFTNFYFNDAAPAGQLASQAQGLVPMAGQEIPVAGNNGNSSIPISDGDPQKDARIAKGVAVKVAAPVIASLFHGAGPEALDEALETLDKAAKHIYGLLTGSSAQQAVPETPAEVADVVNEAAGQVVVGVGATPEW